MASRKAAKRKRMAGILLSAILCAILYEAGLSYVRPAVEAMPQLIHRQTMDYVPYDRISPWFFKALIATEDRRYYVEGGLDWIGIARSLWVDLRTGALVEGGSTITQQLVRDVLLTEQKTFLRKCKEMLIATEAARVFTKEQILEMYANEVYYGNQAYGIAAASRTYFQKEPARLTIAQAALLAGIVQAPSLLDPIAHPANAKARRAIVIENLVETGQIPPEEADALNKEPLLPRNTATRNVSIYE
jgi:membrane peptidoglycan carboxypeptidase